MNNKVCRHGLTVKKCGVCRNICKHSKQKTRCTICGGGSICIHRRERYYCKECKGRGICKHNKYRKTCTECKNISHIENKLDYYLENKLFMNNLTKYIINLSFDIIDKTN